MISAEAKKINIFNSELDYDIANLQVNEIT